MSRRITRRTLRKMILAEMRQIIREEDTVTIKITVPDVPDSVKRSLEALGGAAGLGRQLGRVDWNEALTTMKNNHPAMFDNVMNAMESAADAGEDAFKEYVEGVAEIMNSTKGFLKSMPTGAKLSMGLPGLLIDYL